MTLASVIFQFRGYHGFLARLSYFPRNRLRHLGSASATPSLVSVVGSPRTSTPLMRSKSGLDYDPAIVTAAFDANQPG